MKVLIAGDLHYDKEKFDSLTAMLPDCDVLCLTGDYLDDRLADRGEQIAWVSNWVANITVPVVMCSGNHDLDELAECEWIERLSAPSVMTDNSVWMYRGVCFGAIPYIGAQYSAFARCDVLVSHLPPSNTSTSRQNGADFGDDELYYSIVRGEIRPDYVFCGHVESPDEAMDQVDGVKVINAGSRCIMLDIQAEDHISVGHE